VTAPDLIAPVVAFRAWRVIGARLLSPNIPVRWEGRTMHAACHPVHKRIMLGWRGWLEAEHASPHPDCQCGIYAYHRPGRRNWFGEFDWVEGIVTAWGRLEAHADGLRAEHARIEALVVPGGDQRVRAPVVERIAERLGADLVERGDVEAAARRYGARLPESLIPGSR
jgi:hypothetical protein